MRNSTIPVRRTITVPALLMPLGFAMLVVGALVTLDRAVRADDRQKAELDKMKAEIKRTGKLPANTFWHHAEMRHRGTKQLLAAPGLKGMKAGKTAAAPHTKGSALAVIKADATTVGNPPTGFGLGFVWDRADNEALLVIFLNAADSLGVSIEGVQAGDQVQFLGASGVASFSEDKGDPLASSIVALIAAGAKVAADEENAPEVKPLIDAAEQFAKDQFKATNAKNKRRDAFGVDPASGLKAREEGGVLICMPEAGGTFYSGDSDHKSRWIQGDGVRSDDHLPSHVAGGFFPLQGRLDHNTRTAEQTAPMFVLPWDWNFDDNAGFYKVFLKLIKGNPTQIERKAPPKRK